jgi:hypothetical protein
MQNEQMSSIHEITAQDAKRKNIVVGLVSSALASAKAYNKNGLN